MAPWFAAQYSGRCTVCSRKIEAGDLIRAHPDGDYQCSECTYA